MKALCKSIHSLFDLAESFCAILKSSVFLVIVKVVVMVKVIPVKTFFLK